MLNRRRLSVAIGVAVAGLSIPRQRVEAAAPAGRGRILCVMTSTGEIPGTSRRTGLWWSEFSEPYAAYRASGFEVTAASIRGGAVPVDPRSGGDGRAR